MNNWKTVRLGDVASGEWEDESGKLENGKIRRCM